MRTTYTRRLIGVATMLAAACAAAVAQPATEEAKRSVFEKGGRISLDGEWLFRTDRNDAGLEAEWYRRDATDDWKPIRVPGTWEAQAAPDYDGVGWYRRSFDLPPPRDGLKRGLLFQGVDDQAVVWLNGVKAAEQPHYGRRFAFGIDHLARVGRNDLVVRIRDNGGPGGLIGSVWLAVCRDLDELMMGEHHATPPRESAEWVRDAVIYSAYLRSASPEGTFKGLEKRLDELKALGVTVLWLLPIHPVGVEKRKGELGSPYAVRDFYAVNPEFGTLDDFKSLVAAAHKRDIKVIIDLVINHTAWDNPLIKEHPEWYTKDAAGKIVPPNADWTDVADLNYDAPGLRQYMQDMMLHWVRDIGIDGFRCDVAGMVPLDFWESVRPKLDAVKPVMMLAEDDEPRQHLKAFDVTYDWKLWSALGSLKSGGLTGPALRSIVHADELEFPRGALRLRFTCNHDKNAWETPAITRLGAPGAAAAAVLTFALPGVPLIYNGQEVGFATKLPLFERVPIDWSRDAGGFRELYAQLAGLRRDHVALRRGSLRWLESGLPPDVLGLVRRQGEDDVAILINLSDEPRNIPLTAEFKGRLRLLGTAAMDLAHKQLTLPPHAYWIGQGTK